MWCLKYFNDHFLNRKILPFINNNTVINIRKLSSIQCYHLINISASDSLMFFLLVFFLNLLEDNCYTGFCHTSTWISHGHTYVPSLLNSVPISHPIPPLQVVTERGVEFPVSHRTLLSTWQYMFPCCPLPSPHPLLSTRRPQVCFLSVPPLRPCKQVHQ